METNMKEMNMNELEQANGGKDIWYYLIPNGNPSEKLTNLVDDVIDDVNDLCKSMEKKSTEEFRKAMPGYCDQESLRDRAIKKNLLGI